MRPQIAVQTNREPVPFVNPFRCFLALRERYGAENVYLLESLAGPAKDVRASLVGFMPLLRISVKGCQVGLEGQAGLVASVKEALGDLLLATPEGHLLKQRSDLWQLLRQIQACFALDVPASDGSFSFGYFGYFGYDTAWSVEELPMLIADPSPVADVILVIYQGLISFDLSQRTAKLVLNQAPGMWEPIAPAEIGELLAGCAEADDTIAAMPAVPRPLAVRSSVQRNDYEEGVRRALYYISIGDIYQVQLGHQLEITTSADPLAVYQRLRQRNPSPYMYVAPFGDLALVGASPELFLRVESGKITMRPIAGTVIRGATGDEDAALVAQLQSDEKEVAEHIMLVDLCRNDIGRVCLAGTLEVDELKIVEQYSHVNHLVSNVTGQQQPHVDIYDIIAATFPAGTMTGAPKIRAMEIIEELETARRGPYAGALGLLDFTGYANLALCIRSAVYCGQSYAIRASAGVVADSTPEREWRETLHKMGALYWAISGEEIPYESIGY